MFFISQKTNQQKLKFGKNWILIINFFTYNVYFFSFKNSVRHKRSLNYDTSSNKMNCELMLTYDTPALRQTGSRNLTGQKTLPTIWGTYMTLVTKYQISAINSYWEKCHEKYLGRNEGQTEVKQYTPSPFGEWGYNNLKYNL